jgi:hypothetical protein
MEIKFRNHQPGSKIWEIYFFEINKKYPGFYELEDKKLADLIAEKLAKTGASPERIENETKTVFVFRDEYLSLLKSDGTQENFIQRIARKPRFSDNSR